MKRALIATLYNEADNVLQWWDALMRQAVMPDEIAIVDGGSKDGTWEKLQELAEKCPVPVKLEQRRCNIAGGRNRAIELTDADIIAATDAGSFPEREWFGEVTRPLVEDAKVDAVGGKSVVSVENDLQRLIQSFEAKIDRPVDGVLLCSSRNAAYRRQAWADVGGYPEWLTLTGEDALFTFEMHKIGKIFRHNPNAVVRWAARENERAYFKMLYSYGVGAAEARLFPKSYVVHFAVTLFPPLLLFSERRLANLRFRYLRNLSFARGWLAGRFFGHTAPAGWRRVDGIYMSPEAQQHLPTAVPIKNISSAS
jgi:glycosyltransferase involved in cell wall biosynthesis